VKRLRRPLTLTLPPQAGRGEPGSEKVRVRGVLAGALLLAAGCATAPQPVTKIVNGRVVTTRAVSPEAYEHVTRALLYEEEERWKEAADELQRALPFDPEAAEVRAQLAELFVRQERLDDAAEQIGRSLQIAETVEGYLAKAHLAQAYDDEAHHAQEIPALREAARLALAGDDPESIELTHLELSEAQVVSLDLAGAMDTARRLVDAVPETLRGRTQLAVVGWATGAFDQAAAALAAAIEIEPNDVEARILLAELQVATNKIDAAKDGFRAAIDRAESPMAVADAFAGWLILRGDVAEAQDLADRLVADAGDADTLAVASAFERTVKRPDRAVALAERASKLGLPAGRRALLLGAAALAKDDQAGAAAAYMNVDKREPSFFEARLRAADVLREQGKVDEAERALNDAAPLVSQADTPVQVEERRIELAVALSQVDEKRGDAARAARRLDEAIGKDGDARGDSRLILARAAVDERRGDWQRAVARGEQLLARKPRSVEALNFVGFVAADHNHDMARTLRRVQAAVVLSPGSGAIIDSLGWTYFRTGDLARADVYLEQAARLEPGDPEVLEHLGDLYAKRQERDRALATYRRALGFKPNDRVARELGDRIRTLEAKAAAGR
jgi:tetratricopeptide (TPR) repeat protein